MPAFRGAGGAILILPQASWGTPNTTPGDVRPFRVARMNIAHTPERIQREHLSVGGAGMRSAIISGLVDCSGPCRLPVTYKGFGVLWKAALGSSATTGGAPPYTHEYTPAASLPFHTIYQRTPDMQEYFSGCKLSRLQLDLQAGRDLMADIQWVGEKLVATATSSLISYTHNTYNVVNHKHLQAMTWNGISIKPSRLTLVLDNKVETRHVVGQDETLEPDPSGDGRTVTISAELELESLSLYSAYTAATAANWALDFTLGSEELDFDLDDCILTKYSAPIERDGIIKLRAEWQAQALVVGTDHGLKVTAVNDQATATIA